MKFTLAAIAMFVYLPLPAQHELTVIVEGVRSKKGSIMVGLFRTDEAFLKTPAYGKVVAVEDSGKIVFGNIEPGEYGISVIHDENDNSKLDTHALGIPKEGFAFGNNAMGVFGPPSFNKCKISIDRPGVRHVLRMRYF